VNDFLDNAIPDRRSFIQRIVAAAPFASPTVRSFLIASVAATEIVVQPVAAQTMMTTAIGGAPEIDVSSAATALTLLAGSAAVVRSRRPKTAVKPDDTETDEKKS
jgi:hypothetical protein